MLLTSFHQKHGASSFWGDSFLDLQWRDFFFFLSKIYWEGIPHVVKINPAHWRCFLSRRSFGLLRKTQIFLLAVRGGAKGKICVCLDCLHPNSSLSIAIALVQGFRVWAFLLFPGLSQGPTLDKGPKNGVNNTAGLSSPVSAGQIPSLGFTWQLLLGTPVSQQWHTMQKDTEYRRLTPSLSNLLVDRVHRWS